MPNFLDGAAITVVKETKEIADDRTRICNAWGTVGKTCPVAKNLLRPYLHRLPRPRKDWGSGHPGHRCCSCVLASS